MLREIRVRAPAKINLGLRVLPKREDGFHNIEGIFQTVSLADELIVAPANGTGECKVFCSSLELPQKNTITSAYQAFQDVTGIEAVSMNVEIIKRIPAGGGMGGGSSDAAAFIRALESFYGITLSGEQLDKIAAAVGSDVFFFFHCDKNGDGCAIVTGRGEFVEEIKCRKDLHFVLVFPGVHSSTKEAYSLVDQWYENGKVLRYPALSELESIYNSPVEKWNFVNSFTSPLAARYERIQKALECIMQSGSLFSDMTGSGSTVFGVYQNEQNVKSAVNLLAQEGFSFVTAN